MSSRYGLRWINGEQVWHHVWSFSCVADVRDFATANVPSGAVRFAVTNLATGEDRIERPISKGAE
jgi:hypothetical protein